MAMKQLSGAEESHSLSRPPSSVDILFDKSFRALTCTFTWATILLLAFIVYKIGRQAIPAVSTYGLGFLTSTTWDVNAHEFGILPEIWGTLYSSFLALFLGGFFGITIAIFLTQDFLPHKLEMILKNIIELLAAIPSVVYGLWGIYVLIPLIRPVADLLHDNLGWIPFFSTSLSGPGMFPAVLVLSIMILPTVAAISQDAFRAIPHKTKEAAFGMGTTRWEAILRVMLPTASGGIFGALVLGFGRALGETMALAMLVGNANEISLSLFAPANTLAALLALNFPEAGELEASVLMYAACVLLLITLLVNIAGAAIISRTGSGGKK
ncbi:phosphate ABC transporter permease subunit PstC [Desulfogranum japonicum]|uniref:phosphate ABC transporter permease subunit PstC n=1 Tax=Desulfogranum japonicum TaxID=231447 RepID=UPI0004096964|nr:phosphate ABC transporter permease subunit PstC [Desulfogranum japonicum]